MGTALSHAGLYAAAALTAGAVALFDGIPLQREWGTLALGPYAVAALLAAAVAIWGLRRLRDVRAALAVIVAAVLVAAVVAPLALEIGRRAVSGPATHAQSEVILTEEAARALVHGSNPYAETYGSGPLRGWPEGTWSHVPYMPGMLAFGLPAGLGGSGPMADARVAFLAVAGAVAVAALVLSRTGATRGWEVLLVLVALPTGARYAVGGGDDLPVLAAMLLSLVLLDRGRPLAAGIAAGAAAALKQTAWILLPFLILAARGSDGRPARGRALAGASAVLLAAVVPFAVWNPGAFVDDVILFPLGLAEHPTQAAGPTIGRGLLALGPAGAVILWVLVAAVAATAWYLLVRRPPTDAAGAADRAAILLALAILVASAGRLGYLVYPLNLLVWSRLVLRREEPSEQPATGFLARLAPARWPRTAP